MRFRGTNSLERQPALHDRMKGGWIPAMYRLLSPLPICGGLILLGGWGHPVNAQTPASYGQQLAVLKTLKADVATVGVIESGLSEKSLQDIRRAGIGQGVKIVVGRAATAGEVGPLYKKLVSEYSVQMIWIPDPSDKMLLGIGFEYLRENAVSDKVGLIVPEEGLVQSGALCSILNEGGKLKAYVNQRIAQVLGAAIPGDGGEAVTYVTR